MIIIPIVAIVTLGGLWLRRRYPKIERQQWITSIAIIVAGMSIMARSHPPSWRYYAALTLVGTVGMFLFSSWVRPTRT